METAASERPLEVTALKASWSRARARSTQSSYSSTPAWLCSSRDGSARRARRRRPARPHAQCLARAPGNQKHQRLVIADHISTAAAAHGFKLDTDGGPASVGRRRDRRAYYASRLTSVAMGASSEELWIRRLLDVGSCADERARSRGGAGAGARHGARDHRGALCRAGHPQRRAHRARAVPHLGRRRGGGPSHDRRPAARPGGPGRADRAARDRCGSRTSASTRAAMAFPPATR